MKNYFLKTLILCAISLFVSCDSEDPEPMEPGRFEGGVFVSNEGNFGEGDGSLTYIDAEGSVTNNLFSSINDLDVGDVFQSMHIADNQIFLVVNNSNKVEVASLDSLQAELTITGVSLPRYMTSANGKGYLTEWVSFSDLGQVSIIDLETGAIEKSIPTDFGAEDLIVADGKLFVSNNFSTTVSVIDLDVEEKDGDISVGNSPALMELDADGDIWLVCAGGTDSEFNPLNDGKLVEIDPETESVIKEIELNTNLSGKIAMNPAGTILYYLIGNSIYAIETTASEAPAEAWATASDAISFYGLGVSPEGKVYAADAKGFAENGVVYQYSASGQFEATFTVGRGPNGFAFN